MRIRVWKTFATALPAIFAFGCAEGETVVREADNAERLAEYEQVAEAATDEAGALTREVVGEGPDYDREARNDSAHDRYERPANTPRYDIPKTQQVGATVCPEDMRMDGNGDIPVTSAEYKDWLLDLDKVGRVNVGNGKSYGVATPGIERGVQPQSLSVVKATLNGDDVKLTPAKAGSLGSVLMKMTPCEVAVFDADLLDEAARRAIDADDRVTGVMRLQLVEVG